jgi:hypothetical protein
VKDDRAWGSPRAAPSVSEPQADKVLVSRHQAFVVVDRMISCHIHLGDTTSSLKSVDLRIGHGHSQHPRLLGVSQHAA